MATNSASRRREGGTPARQTIVVVDGEPLSRDCLAEVLGSAFHPADVLAVPSVEEVPPEEDSEHLLAVVKRSSGTPHSADQDVRTLVQRFPGLPVAVITPCDEQVLSAVIEAGAQALLPLSTPLRIGIAALRLVLAGGTYFPIASDCRTEEQDRIRVANGASVDQHSTGASAAAPHPAWVVAVSASAPELDGHAANRVKFTEREAEVLAGLQRGRSNKWIARQLNLSENTIKVHIRHIMWKLQARNRTEAVIISSQLMTGG